MPQNFALIKMSLFSVNKLFSTTSLRSASSRTGTIVRSKNVMTTRKLSSTEAAEESGSLAAAVGTTFVTYMMADFLSNFIQHPTQKMDYGYFNQFLDRPVENNWWGTRTQHIVGVAAALAGTDHASQAYFSKQLGRPLCFAKSPSTFVAHTFFFIFAGVTIYVAGDAAMNPDIADGKRGQAFAEGTYASAVGSCTAWFEPYVAPCVATLSVGAANSWAGSALLPATLAYATVKGVGWDDWGNSGLNDLEKKMNGVE